MSAAEVEYAKVCAHRIYRIYWRFWPPSYGVLDAAINSAGSISILNVNGTEVDADNVRPFSFVRHKPNLV
jgi:hypothetical protein